MKLSIEHHAPPATSYRARRVESLFNADDNGFKIEAELPLEGVDWSIGVIVGPSGSGKTTLGRRLFGDKALRAEQPWPHDRPIVDAIAPEGSFDAVTSALAAVGLGSVPAWLRPYPVLSNGERFRADLARVLVEAPAAVVIDASGKIASLQARGAGIKSAVAKAMRAATASAKP